MRITIERVTLEGVTIETDDGETSDTVGTSRGASTTENETDRPAPLTETVCEHCGERFVYRGQPTQFDGSDARYECPHCSRWTSGPPPSPR